MGLGLLAKAFLWLGLPAAIASLIWTSPTTAAILPIIMLPTVWSRYQRQSLPSEHRANMEVLALTFWAVGTVGMSGVIILQSIISYRFASLLFSKSEVKTVLEEFGRSSTRALTADQMLTRVALASSWQYFALLLLFTYGLAGGLEELLKYAPIALLGGHEPPTPSRLTRATRYISLLSRLR